MAELDIVGIGLSTLDVLIRLGDMPSWEKGGSISSFGLDGGGPVGTACVAASRLGARVGYIGIAGNDDVARLKIDSLVENGVDVSHLAIREHPETHVIIVYVHEETGERVFAGLRNLGRFPVEPEELSREYITSARYLHLDGWHPDAALQAAEWMHEVGGTVCIDCAKTNGGVRPRTEELVRSCDIVICGSGFGPALTGRSDLWEAGEAILDLGPRIVVQTEGEDGSYTTTADERFHTPAFAVDVHDTTGAGDVFHGAYLVGMLRGWDLRTIATFATGVSALKCTRLGGRKGIPSFEEVACFLHERGIDLPVPVA
jgi:sulfofructose kinase